MRGGGGGGGGGVSNKHCLFTFFHFFLFMTCPISQLFASDSAVCELKVSVNRHIRMLSAEELLQTEMGLNRCLIGFNYGWV